MSFCELGERGREDALDVREMSASVKGGSVDGVEVTENDGPGGGSPMSPSGT